MMIMKGRLQFSLKHLLWATMWFALWLGAWAITQHIYEKGPPATHHQRVAPYLLIPICWLFLFGSPFAAVWSLLGKPRFGIALGIAVAVLAAILLYGLLPPHMQ